MVDPLLQHLGNTRAVKMSYQRENAMQQDIKARFLFYSYGGGGGGMKPPRIGHAHPFGICTRPHFFVSSNREAATAVACQVAFSGPN